MKIMWFKFYDHSSDSDSEWKEISEYDDTHTIIEAVGFLIKEDEFYYHIAQAHGDDQYSNGFRILKSAIIKKKEWKLKT